jgi:threonine/homoserine/homoserine lactone efflux protein
VIGVALAAGAVAGFAGSVPVSGPVSAMAFRQGLAGEYGGGMRLALGGALAKGIYAALAVWATAAALGGVAAGSEELGAAWARGALGVAALALGALGVGLLTRGPSPLRTRSGWAPGVGTGFVVTLCNPTVLATFGVVAGLLRARGVAIEGVGAAAAFGAGAALGMAGWYAALMGLLRRFGRRLGEGGRRWLSRGMGAVLCGVALSCAARALGL